MQKLLVIGYVWPEPKSSAAGARMMQLLEFFLAEGFSISFASTASETAFSTDLSRLGISSEKILLNDPSFDSFARDLDPDVVLFDRFMMEEQFGWRISEACPEALKILDTEDLHFLRKARHETIRKKKELSPDLLFSDLAKREIASIYRCDLSLIISEFEMQLLRNEFQVPENLLYYLPFMINIPSEEKIAKLPPFEEREHFVSIGNFRHEPNWDAVLNLKTHIWPLIRKELPQAEMHIYGAYASEKVFQLHDPLNGFLIKGRAESAKKVIQKAKVLLAPLRFGAGMKGKFTDAMQTGTPVVTTSLGAESMSKDNIWNGSITDEPSEFATAAVALYRDKEKWKEAAKNGFEILKKNFDAAQHRQRFREHLNKLSSDFESHRNSNFTGQMLTHHSINATKYLSRYIEMKMRLEKETALNKDRP